MKSNVLLIIEIFLAILTLFFFLNIFKIEFYLDTRGFIEEDIYASIISINYQNISSINELGNILCSIVSEITPEYAIYMNETLICGPEEEDYNRTIKTFYVINGEIIYVYIKTR